MNNKSSASRLLFVALLSLAPALHAEQVISGPSEWGVPYQSDWRERQIRKGLSPTEPWLGLVGDSGISGAATAENLHATFSAFHDTILNFLSESTYSVQKADIKRIPHPERFGLDGPSVEPLVRVLYSMDEFREAQAEENVPGLNFGAKGSLRLDIPEYSYGYLTGRALGLPASRIVLTAQDGQRVDSIYKQMKRFGEVSPTLPSTIIVSYSANDICGDELKGSIEEFSTNFRKTIERELSLTVQNLKPHPTLGSKVVVMAPLDVPQILTNKALFAQKIYFAGTPKKIWGHDIYMVGAGQKTCGDVRFNTAAQNWAGRKMQETLVSMCGSVISTSPDDTAKVQRILDFQNEQIRVWKEVLGGLQARGWSFELNEASRRPIYETGDLAHDCFHPGPSAHAKLAEELVRSLGTSRSTR